MKDKNEKEKITLLKRADAEIVVNKSRFIGHAAPVRDESEANAFISEMKSIYADATHNVFAYYIGGGAISRCSDDGEPQGSSGYPTLNALKMCGADDLCVVVTRYFGGVLLGTGGLARAYAAAARAAVEASGFAHYGIFKIVRIELGYSEYQKLSSKLANEGIPEENVEFSDKVSLTAALRGDTFDGISAYLTDLTKGMGNITVLGEEERRVPSTD